MSRCEWGVSVVVEGERFACYDWMATFDDCPPTVPRVGDHWREREDGPAYEVVRVEWRRWERNVEVTLREVTP